MIINKLIYKIDKWINPNKYGLNYISKPIKSLQGKDKLYVVFLPKITLYKETRLTLVLESIELISVNVDFICHNVENIQFGLNVKEPFGEVKNILGNTASVTNLNGTSTLYVAGKITKKKSFAINAYNGELIFTTDKNDIVYFLKNYAQQIKNIIKQKTNTNNIEKQYKQKIFYLINKLCLL